MKEDNFRTAKVWNMKLCTSSPIGANFIYVLQRASKAKMITREVLLCLVALLVVWVSHCVYRWKNPKCHGKLPPGSMGFPFIGETIQFFIPNHSLYDIPPFIRSRMARYVYICVCVYIFIYIELP
ncbi:hypothetical protein FEM48_Zijuj07G0164900 [Ziziphus jujuba var. spinosa]|uniref:Uncharacterized protein n=1 Tax=Ziziphus jujuba var. spinosa TaxID=714518 RepID=A0A978V5Q2_ZIZJJ|nr:hypothetical protein FEM48_Zijuj07G0164900 [Ziziphus jujuba var. spinosa]